MFFNNDFHNKTNPTQAPSGGDSGDGSAAPPPLEFSMYSINGSHIIIDDVHGKLVKVSSSQTPGEWLSEEEISKVTVLAQSAVGLIEVPLSKHPFYSN